MQLFCNAERNQDNDPCYKNNCKHGTCQSFSGTYICVCDEDHWGEFCQNKFNFRRLSDLFEKS